MTIDAITFEIGGSPSVELQLATSDGLAPLPLPQPPQDAVRRFQAAMEDGVPREDSNISRKDVETQREFSGEVFKTGLTGFTGLEMPDVGTADTLREATEAIQRHSQLRTGQSPSLPFCLISL